MNVVIIIITYHRNKSFQPRKLMKIFHSISVGICTRWRRLARLMIRKAEASKKSLDDSQL